MIPWVTSCPPPGSCLAGARAPPDFPVCGLEGEDCRGKADNVALILSVVLSCVLVAVFVIGYFVHRKYKEEAEIAQMNWKIDPMEVMRSKEHRGRWSQEVYCNTSQS